MALQSPQAGLLVLVSASLWLGWTWVRPVCCLPLLPPVPLVSGSWHCWRQTSLKSEAKKSLSTWALSVSLAPVPHPAEGTYFPWFFFCCWCTGRNPLVALHVPYQIQLKVSFGFPNAVPTHTVPFIFFTGHLSLEDRGLHPLQAGSHLLLICSPTAWVRLSQFSLFTGHSSQSCICYKGTWTRSVIVLCIHRQSRSCCLGVSSLCHYRSLHFPCG